MSMDSAPYTKTGQPIVEDLSGRTQKTVNLEILLMLCKGIKTGLNAVAATTSSATEGVFNVCVSSWDSLW